MIKNHLSGILAMCTGVLLWRDPGIPIWVAALATVIIVLPMVIIAHNNLQGY